MPGHGSERERFLLLNAQRRITAPGVYRVMSTVNAVIETDIPARLDRLPWSRFHTLVIVALGITWILDGFEVTLAGSISGALQQSPVLHFSEVEIGLVTSAYLVGAVSGASSSAI